MRESNKMQRDSLSTFASGETLSIGDNLTEPQIPSRNKWSWQNALEMGAVERGRHVHVTQEESPALTGKPERRMDAEEEGRRADGQAGRGGRRRGAYARLA